MKRFIWGTHFVQLAAVLSWDSEDSGGWRRLSPGPVSCVRSTFYQEQIVAQCHGRVTLCGWFLCHIWGMCLVQRYKSVLSCLTGICSCDPRVELWETQILIGGPLGFSFLLWSLHIHSIWKGSCSVMLNLRMDFKLNGSFVLKIVISV